MSSSSSASRQTSELEDTREDRSCGAGPGPRDYEARIGRPFEHAEYLSQLADLRDRLKLGLSDKADEAAKPAGEIAAKIKGLPAANTVESAPVRERKAAAGEMPVTARIKRRAETAGPEPVEPPQTAEEPVRQAESSPDARAG